MLTDMTKISSALETLDKAARTANTTLVFCDSGEPRRETLNTSRKRGTWPIFIWPDVKGNLEHRHVGMNVRTAQGANRLNGNAVGFHSLCLSWSATLLPRRADSALESSSKLQARGSCESCAQPVRGLRA